MGNSVKPLQNGTFCPISASGSKSNPRNIPYITVVEIFTFLELEQKLPFFKGLIVLYDLQYVKRLEFCFQSFINSGMNNQQRKRALFECIRDR